jgi:hypothetical protein
VFETENPKAMVVRRYCSYCFLVDISYSMCEYKHRLSSWIAYMHCVVICVVAVKYAGTNLTVLTL